MYLELDAVLQLLIVGVGEGWYENCMGLRVRGEVISYSTWIFEQFPKKQYREYLLLSNVI